MAIEGYISPVNCFVHIRGSRDDKAAYLSTLIHELTHYVQLVATPVGIQIRTRQVWLSSDMSIYLHNAPQPVNMGQLGTRLRQLPTSPTATEEHLRRRLKDCKVLNKPFFTSGSLILFDSCFPNSSESDSEAYASLRKRRPLEVDPDAGCIYLKNSDTTVPVGANSIMEYMARLVQLYADGGLRTPESLFNAMRERGRAPYHLPLIFLIQEGILENLFGWPFLYKMLMTLMQASLLIDPLSIDRASVEKHSLGQSFLPQTLFLRALFEPELFNSFVFAAIHSEAKKTGNENGIHKSFADAMLRSLDWPTVSDLLAIFKRDIEDNIDLASNKGRARATVKNAAARGTKFSDVVHASHAQSGGLPKSTMRTRQYETFRDLVFELWRNEKYLINPAEFIPHTPAPMQAEVRDGGIALSCTDPNQTFWDPQFELISTVTMHICQKILYSGDLACYSDPLGQTALFDCPFVNECSAIPTKTNLDFCRRDEWKAVVNHVLDLLEVTVC